jgi:hypothetical protein
MPGVESVEVGPDGTVTLTLLPGADAQVIRGAARRGAPDRSRTSASLAGACQTCSGRRSGSPTYRPRCESPPLPRSPSSGARAIVNAAWWRDTWLIARREIEERPRARSFRITTAIMILAVAAAVLIPAIVSHHHKIEKVGLLGASDSALTQAAIAAGRVTGNRVQVVPVASLDAARAELRSGALAAVIVGGREVLIKAAAGERDDLVDRDILRCACPACGRGAEAACRRAARGAHERDRDSDPGASSRHHGALRAGSLASGWTS